MITHHNIIPVYCARQINSIFSFGQNRTVPGANNVISESGYTGYNKGRISGNGRSAYLYTRNARNRKKGMVVSMEKYAWRGKIVPGMQEEYKKRHDNIWPEMKEVLANAGIVNYSIWMQGEELFGYYECEKGVDYAAKVQAESDVVKKWDEYMKDILIMEKDPVTGAQPLLTQVFSFR